MAKADLQPIEIVSAVTELRITVPKTAPVERFYRRSRAIRLIALVAFSIVCITIGLLDFRNIVWEAMWFLFALMFGSVATYAILYPYRIEIFVPDTSVMCLSDSNLTVTEVQRARTRCFAAGDISSIKAIRCDFTRCSKLVVGAKRHGRRYRAVIAIYAEYSPVALIADKLSQSLHLEQPPQAS